jgi:hypothetical protein
MKQEVVIITYNKEDYYDFWFSRCIGTGMSGYIKEGWIAKIIKDDPDSYSVSVLFEKETE